MQSGYGLRVFRVLSGYVQSTVRVQSLIWPALQSPISAVFGYSRRLAALRGDALMPCHLGMLAGTGPSLERVKEKGLFHN